MNNSTKQGVCKDELFSVSLVGCLSTLSSSDKMSDHRKF